LCRADTDREAVYNTSDNKHRNILRSRYNDAANNPDDGADHDRLFSTKDICDKARAKGSKPGTSSHGRSDATLDISARTAAGGIALIKVAFVGIGANDGAHGGDIKAKKAAANDGDGRNEVILRMDVSMEACTWS
jgi:hypothetical protein